MGWWGRRCCSVGFGREEGTDGEDKLSYEFFFFPFSSLFDYVCDGVWLWCLHSVSEVK